MSFLTNQLPAIALFTGSETLNADTNLAAGVTPSQEAVSLATLVLILRTMQNSLSKTMVDGTIYYTAIDIGVSYDPAPQGSNQSLQSYKVTGVNVPVGATGGTDTWHVAIYNSAGVLVGRSATAGVTAGTALTIQQIPLAGASGAATGADAPITVNSGRYYVALQGNGNTANFLSINSPIWPTPTGSQTGTAGTLAALSPIADDYTADLGPQVSLY